MPLCTEVHVSIGSAYQSFEGINSELTSLELPVLSNYSTAFGYGGSVLLNKLVLGGQGSIFINRNTHSKQLELHALGGSGGIYAGYSLLRKAGTMIYPTLGFNYGSEQLHIVSKTANDIVLESQTFASSLKSSNQKSALSCELNYDTYYRPTSGPGLMVGFRLGYYYKLNTTLVHFEDENGQSLNEISSSSPGMFLASLKIGFGTFTVLH